jgi:HEAT repeat protein
MIADGYANLQEKIAKLISDLHDPDGLKRMKARMALIHIGWEAVPGLIKVVSDETGTARWEAIEALEKIRDPSAADVLIDALRDDSSNIRWAASNALAELDRAGLKPLLEALTRDFGSASFREVAHHILHVLNDRGRLLPKEVDVFRSLEGPEPAIQAPWAAEAALEDMLSLEK